MSDYIKELTEKVLNSTDYIKVLRESTYNVKTFEEFVKQLQEFDERVQKKDIKTTLIVDTDDGQHYVKWEVDQDDRVLCVLEFENGKVKCNKTYRFRAPGRYNVNDLTDPNQILKLLDSYVFSLERDDVIKQKQQGSSNNQQSSDENKKDKKELSPEEKEDLKFVMDPGVRQVLEDLKTKGDDLISKIMSVPPYKTKEGKEYKLQGGKLLSSTEKELVAVFDFSRTDDIDIYSPEKAGEKLRTEIIKHYTKNGNYKMDFRLDMDKTPYFYTSVGKLPVKKESGPEARAMLNYYDGAVRFQPKEERTGWEF